MANQLIGKISQLIQLHKSRKIVVDMADLVATSYNSNAIED